MDDNLRVVALGLLGGFLGWSLGKILDRLGGGVPYAVIAGLCLALVVIITVR